MIGNDWINKITQRKRDGKAKWEENGEKIEFFRRSYFLRSCPIANNKECVPSKNVEQNVPPNLAPVLVVRILSPVVYNVEDELGFPESFLEFVLPTVFLNQVKKFLYDGLVGCCCHVCFYFKELVNFRDAKRLPGYVSLTIGKRGQRKRRKSWRRRDSCQS